MARGEIVAALPTCPFSSFGNRNCWLKSIEPMHPANRALRSDAEF
jgi:hypothetical protein